MGREKTYFMLYNISQYRETIKIMMRHGGIVSNMAKKLGYPEKDLVNYIKAEGLDIELMRRGWKWIRGCRNEDIQDNVYPSV